MDNEDLIAEILSHVGGEDLCRFKLVSKAWENLISTHPRLQPSFQWGLCITTLDKTARRRRVTFKRSSDSGNLEDYNLLSFSIPDDMDVLDSCNGLLLVGTPIKMSVYDPFTHHRTDLPTPLGSDLPMLTIGMAADSPQNYSVVRVLTDAEEDMYDGSNPIYFEVYSSETRKWVIKGGASVEISQDGFQELDGMMSRALYLDGALYWIIGNNLILYRPKEDYHEVVQFDDYVPFLPCLMEMEGRIHFVGGLIGMESGSGVHVSKLLLHRDPGEQECEFIEWNHKSLITHADINPSLSILADLEPVGYNERLQRVYLVVQGREIVSCTCGSNSNGGSQEIHTEIVSSLDGYENNCSILPFKCSSGTKLKRSAEVLDKSRHKRTEV